MRGLIQGFGHLLAPVAQQFHQALDQPERAQATVQQRICDRLTASEYGKSLNIQSIADWSRLPVVSYEDLEPWILQAGLTPEPILFYEKTSGSSRSAKWIPYTRSLRRSFSQMFCVWAYDLIQNGPRFSTGKLYACLSPQLSEDGDASPASLQNDADYLDGWLRWLLKPFLVMPPGLNKICTPQQFKHQLCLSLLQAERLETISIWSPSFLQVQLEYIQTHQIQLREELQQQLSRDRWQLLTEPEIPWTQLWSHLKLISCWDSAQSADRADGLRSQFPGVWVQGKGLLATEAPMTIPLIAAQGCVPVLNQVLFEFEDEAGSLHRLHELSRGQTYTLVLSQLGGLYRYRIGDRVQVTHWYRQTPCLEFVGRDPAVSDLVGEKLHAAFVQTALHQMHLPAHFISLVPIAEPPHYLLLLDRATEAPTQLSDRLDRVLCQSHHYRHARLLGQLAAPQVMVSSQIPELLALSKNGGVWAGIKHPLLATSPLDAIVLQQLQALTHG
jgi:hypothetical protein